MCTILPDRASGHNVQASMLIEIEAMFPCQEEYQANTRKDLSLSCADLLECACLFVLATHLQIYFALSSK